MIAVDDVIDPETGEVYLDAGKPFTAGSTPRSTRLMTVDDQARWTCWRTPKDPIIIQSLNEDGTSTATSRRC